LWVNGTKYDNSDLELSIGPTGNGDLAVTFDSLIGFEYETDVHVTINAVDVHNRAMEPDDYYFTIQDMPEGKITMNLTVFLQGYYDGGVHRPATINIQLRPTQNIASGPSIEAELDASGSAGTLILPKMPGVGNDFYLVIWHKLPGEALGVNHLVYVSSANIDFSSAVTINLTDSGSPYYHEPFVPQTGTGQGSLYDEGGSVMSLKGGDASGDQYVSLVDIVRWDNAATSANANQRSKPGFKEDVNFNGDDYINTDDFGVWKKNDGQSVPMPEDD